MKKPVTTPPIKTDPVTTPSEKAGIEMRQFQAIPLPFLLHLEIRNKNELFYMKSLINRTDKINEANDRGQTALHIAAKAGKTAVIKALLDAGIDVNIADSDGDTALHIAAKIGNTKVIKTLLEKEGINVNEADNQGWTPLHLTAFKGNTKCFKILLEKKGIDVNLKDKFGRTALRCAALYNYPEVIKLLLKQPNIDVNQADNDGNTPLLTAKNQEGQSIETINLLQACGAGEDKAAAKTSFEALDDTGKLSVAYYYYFQQNTEPRKDFFQALDGETRTSLATIIKDDRTDLLNLLDQSHTNHLSDLFKTRKGVTTTAADEAPTCS